MKFLTRYKQKKIFFWVFSFLWIIKLKVLHFLTQYKQKNIFSSFQKFPRQFNIEEIKCYNLFLMEAEGRSGKNELTERTRDFPYSFVNFRNSSYISLLDK